MRAEVIVVGGGAVGLLLAAELAGYGVDTVLFEPLPAVSERPRATTVHARAVQSLVRRGRLPWLAPLHTAGEVVRPFRYAGLPGLALRAPGSEPEPLLKMAQAPLERAFEEQASVAGARIRRGYRVVGLHQGADSVFVTAEGHGGTIRCAAQYVVGADGARGAVRKLAEFDSDAWPATVSCLMGLFALPDPEVLRPGWHDTGRGWIVATPTGDRDVSLRTLAPCAPTAADRERPPTPEEVRREVARIVGREIPLEEPRWLSRFSDFARLVRSYRLGRVLLAGDAAHVHFPIGGQGLTTGLLDAVNLGWKLAHVVRGAAPARLLDSYDAERRPAARRVITDTRVQLELMRPDPVWVPVRELLAERLADPRISAALSATISAQGTVLPPSSARPSGWEGRFLENRFIGTPDGRIDIISLLRPGRPLLLLSEPEAERLLPEAAPWADLLRVVRTTGESDVPGEALLVRPDGYIAWAPGGDSLAESLTAYFGSATTRGSQESDMASTGKPSG